ncbi:TetR/AcrR family transcriptional regulator [Aeromicrobium sp. CF4.19]|uniref:TetR/AcrR family transcriptional regulator n=1 Tax=Aeromicrobium sp. CF4.19 TaxID=3373082 RepID=UPI003EE7CA5F
MTATYRESVQGLLRDRLLDATREMVETSGWASVTMARVAAVVGVSRQTVHNEIGTRQDLAQALALRELSAFLDVVRARMSAEPDIISGIRGACVGVLVFAESSLLVRTIVTSVPHEHDAELLKTITTESGQIVDVAGTVVKQCITEGFAPLPLDDAELDVAVETVVRLVLSAITRPSKPPAETADDIAWIVGLALQGATQRG